VARVVIADNDRGVSDLLREVLEQQGLAVEVVADGEAAVRRVAAGGVDLLVCDLDMPRLGGEEVLARLGSMPDGPPVVVISGFLDAAVQARLTRHRCLRGVFAKPFDVLRFASRVAQLAGAAAGAQRAVGEG
jgi:two-component system response regulator AtoC